MAHLKIKKKTIAVLASFSSTYLVFHPFSGWTDFARYPSSRFSTTKIFVIKLSPFSAGKISIIVISHCSSPRWFIIFQLISTIVDIPILNTHVHVTYISINDCIPVNHIGYNSNYIISIIYEIPVIVVIIQLYTLAAYPHDKLIIFSVYNILVGGFNPSEKNT